MKKIVPVIQEKVVLKDDFWTERQQVVREKLIPYQWDALNDQVKGVEPSHTIENFRIAAGESEGEFYGMVFQDSDLYKWLETVAYSLINYRDKVLEAKADEVIDLIGRAQEEDGYLNTHYTVIKPDRKWSNLRDDHELYCAGHLIEAAVAYYEATNKDNLLKIAVKFADLIHDLFGPKEGQIRGYPGHPEVELALMRLFKVTGNRNYVDLCKFFIDERGAAPHYYESEKRDNDWKIPHSYNQSHAPIREQSSIKGHSVRAAYLYTGVAELAAELGEQELFDACKRLWRNTVDKKMYVTGAIGSSHHFEAFTIDYDLPNDRAYAETCASISLVFWAQKMLQIEVDSEYANVMERAIYNGVISGMSLDGTKYFYVNPLEVLPEAAEHRHDLKATKVTRQGWFTCACCPPNIGRFISSFGQYMYSVNDHEEEVYVHLYAGSKAETELGGEKITFQQETTYPWKGSVQFKVNPENEEKEFTLALRVPDWCDSPELTVNGEKIELSRQMYKGYAKVKRRWKKTDEILFNLPMEVQLLRSHPEVRENSGKVAVQYGPNVYCLEEEDNGKNLQEIRLSEDTEFRVDFYSDLLNGVNVISAKGERLKRNDEKLYSKKKPGFEPFNLTLVPYFSWANRSEGEMITWVREKE